MTSPEEAQHAARLLREHAYVRVVAREDGDVLCGAAVLGHALRREGIDFHASWAPRITAALAASLQEESNDLVLLLGFGDADAPAARTVRLDARDDAALAVSAHAVAVALSPKNGDLAPLAVAGAMAARRHVGGWTGADAALLADAERSGLVGRATTLPLRGGTLLESLGSLDEPAVAGLTGRARNAKKLLSDAKLMAEMPPGQLTPADAERLGSLLALKLLQQDAPDVAVQQLARPSLRAHRGPHTGMDAADLAWTAEAAAALGKGGLGFAALWPDEAASAELMEAAAALREEIVAALVKAEREARREGPLAVADAPRAGLCAPLADRLALVLPAVAVARAVEGDGATLALRSYARPLAGPARAAARACGGEAAGAAGSAVAHVPAAEEGRFLKTLAEGLA